MTVQDYTDRWSRLVLALKSRASVDNIASRLRLINSRIGSREIGKLTHSAIQDLFTELARQYSPQSLRAHWSALHGLLVSARRDRLISELPDAPHMPRIRQISRPWYSPQEMRRLILYSTHPLNELIATLAETGLRIGEALALDHSSVRGNLLSITKTLYRGQAGPPKTDNAFRTLSLSVRLTESLSVLARVQGAILFPNQNQKPMWPADISKTMARIVAPAAEVEWKGWHALRRGNVTLMRSLGVSPVIRLYREGHSAKGGLLEAVYDQTQGLTAREREEERAWAEEISYAIWEGNNETQ